MNESWTQAMPWWGFAILAALFAGLVGIFGKIGVENVNSSLATAVRASIMMAVTVGIVLVQGQLKDVGRIPGRSMLFIFLSGLAGALSWLAYFAALQRGQAARVAPIDRLSVAITVILAIIFLNERLSPPALVGVLMIIGGTYLVARG